MSADKKGAAMRRREIVFPRIDPDSPDHREAVEKSVGQALAASKYEGAILLGKIGAILALAAAVSYVALGVTDVFWIVIAVLIGTYCVSYAVVSRTLGIEVALAIVAAFIELYGNHTVKLLSAREARERSNDGGH